MQFTLKSPYVELVAQPFLQDRIVDGNLAAVRIDKVLLDQCSLGHADIGGCAELIGLQHLPRRESGMMAVDHGTKKIQLICSQYVDKHKVTYDSLQKISISTKQASVNTASAELRATLCRTYVLNA